LATDAHTTSEGEITGQLGETAQGGIYLNHYYDVDEDKATKELRYHRDRHLLVFGPTGSGKSKRFLVPNLLLSLEDSSVIVIDPKGELAALTADYRRSLGHDVDILCPFGVEGFESSGFNPLASINPDLKTFYDDCAGIGEGAISLEGHDPHWPQSAQGLFVGLTMWEIVCAKREKRTPSLENVRRLLTEPYETAVDPETGRRRPVKGLPVIAAEACAKGGDAIESLLGRFVRENDEIASIQSTLDTQTRWLLSEPIRDDLRKNGIDFSKLKKKKTTVYVILPPERMRTHSVWLRLVIVSALRALYSEGGLRTVMMIDEMAALGHLGPLEDAFGLVRGYNIQIAAILQDLPQLKAIYKERWETFIANAGIVFGFAPNDLTTADWMSKRSGQTTVVVKSVSENRSQSVGPNTNTNIGSGTGDQQMARPLYLPHEFMGLWEGFGVMWIAGSDGTTRTYSPFYLDIKRCRERAAKRPNSVNL